jgi:hypothetical protein
MQLFCVSDPRFYDAPDRLADETGRFSLDRDPPQPGWDRFRHGLWTALRPLDVTVPEQGWKIHVAAVPEQAATTLDTVAGICLPRRVAFKFLRSDKALGFSTDKYMPRPSSGKFITIYPNDEAGFADLLRALVRDLDGRPGPYILSDMRIERGPVFVRYGAFVPLSCPGPDGEAVPGLRDPDGAVVPDDRGPTFRFPAWVEPPEILRAHLNQKTASARLDLPYRVQRALHFTNGGGTYLAQDRSTGQLVVLREARPYSGHDGTGTDAVQRLRREHAALNRLDGVPWVPRLYGLHTVWEHEYLAEEYIEGTVLLSEVISRHPMRYLDPSPEAMAAYLDWVRRVIDQLSQALDELHERGVSFGDLHLGNVIVGADDAVRLIDFEYAGDARSTRRPRVGAPGFVAPAGVTGADADRYALYFAWLAMLMPLAELIDHDAGKADTILAQVRRLFALGPDDGPPRPPVVSARHSSGEAVVTELFEAPQWTEIRRLLVAGILAAATPDRPDRLFPADPRVFDDQAAGVAYGAAGVVLALHRAGAEVPPEYVDWIVTAGRTRPHRPGLLDGVTGTAVVLDELGRTDEAVEMFDRCCNAARPDRADLARGQAGMALALCHFAERTGEDRWLDAAVRTGHRLDALVSDRDAGGLRRPDTAGLLYGLAGAALVHMRLFKLTGDESWRRAARRALAADMARCVRMPDGTVQVKDGRRHLLYLESGSGGIAVVAQEYLRHGDDEELARFVAAVARGCGHEFVREPGLYQGRAGLMAIQNRLDGRDAALAQVRRLGWHAVHRDGQLLIPGRRLRRFSADLATGSAGVLLALHGVFAGTGDLLPLLPAYRG